MANYPSCEIGAYYAIMRSARILDDLERIGVPGVVGAYSHPAAASGWGMVVVSMQQQYAGHAAQVLALTAQCPAAAYYTKWIIAVDEDVDPTDFNQVMWALSTRCNPSGRYRHPAQHLVDRARSQPVSAGGAALRLEGADQRLQAAPAHEKLSASTLCAARSMSAWRRAGRNSASRTRRRSYNVPQGLTRRLASPVSGYGARTWAPVSAPGGGCNQCSRNSPSMASSAGLISRECATVHRMQRPFELLQPEREEPLQLGKLREQVVVLPDVGLQQPLWSGRRYRICAVVRP